jgi:transcriptional regulator with XRE-family HTH domain
VLILRAMTGKGLRQALRRLGLTQMGLARKLRVAPQTVRRWVADKSPIPEAVSLLLQEWTHKEAP